MLSGARLVHTIARVPHKFSVTGTVIVCSCKTLSTMSERGHNSEIAHLEGGSALPGRFNRRQDTQRRALKSLQHGGRRGESPIAKDDQFKCAALSRLCAAVGTEEDSPGRALCWRAARESSACACAALSGRRSAACRWKRLIWRPRPDPACCRPLPGRSPSWKQQARVSVAPGVEDFSDSRTTHYYYCLN